MMLSPSANLLDGELVHRDSLGTEIEITPGALNWMTAGRGIVHSERTPGRAREGQSRLSGVQAWVALPRAQEDTDPAFTHIAASDLPTVDDEGKHVRLIAGSLFGMRSPVTTASDTLYAEISMDAGARIPVPVETEERAAYLLSGTIDIADQRFEPGRLLLFRPGDAITITAHTPARFMLLGGEVMDGPRFLWWNFVASSRDRIEQAKELWRSNGFPAISNDTGALPLPEDRPPQA